MLLVCFWCVFNVCVLMCFQYVFLCVFGKNVLFRAQREEQFLVFSVCFQCVFGMFLVCFWCVCVLVCF